MTDREWEIMQLMLQRRSTREIADALYVSVGTVRSHVSALMHKVGAVDRDDLITIVERAGARVDKDQRCRPFRQFAGWHNVVARRPSAEGAREGNGVGIVPRDADPNPFQQIRRLQFLVVVLAAEVGDLLLAHHPAQRVLELGQLDEQVVLGIEAGRRHRALK